MQPTGARARSQALARMTGESPPMLEVFRQIRAVANSRAPVFIMGETGTGKELSAAAIHACSGRAGGPFIAVNCGAIPRELIESELFGHLKGSFTGAIADRCGAVVLANGGTLFLDEICEMDVAQQVKLLRFLQTGEIQLVGSSLTQTVDVRVICATNRNPLDEIRAGRFRDDLYFRLHVLPLQIPPLRLRGKDILMLARQFLASFSVEEGKLFRRLSESAEIALMAHHWPGNIRELQNVIRRAVVLYDGEVLDAEMLSLVAPASPTPSRQLNDDPETMDVSGLRRVHAAMSLPASFFSRELWRIERDIIASGRDGNYRAGIKSDLGCRSVSSASSM